MADGTSPTSILGWLQRECTTQGRLGRVDFWIRSFALSFLITLCVGLITLPVVALGFSPDWVQWLSIFALPLYASIVVRRLHDVGLSGWWGLPMLCAWGYSVLCGYRARVGMPDIGTDVAAEPWWIVVIGALTVIVLLFWPGSSQPNQYGP